MKALFFLLFVQIFPLLKGVRFSVRFAGRIIYENDFPKDTKVRYPATFEKYPKKIPTFVDDTYACRNPLGMSYFMLKGTVPYEWRQKKNLKTHTVALNRFYPWYKLKAYSYIYSYLDLWFAHKHQGTWKRFDDMELYVEIQLHGMSIVDGIVLSGGNRNNPDKIARFGSSWFFALLRYTVNYTSNYKEWVPYTNKEGVRQQLLLLETVPKDGVARPGYTRFQPRIIARAIRINHIAYRSLWNWGPGMNVEVFGCSYDGENAGLQAPVENKTGYYWLTKDTVLPWQLYGAGVNINHIPDTCCAVIVQTRDGGLFRDFKIRAHCEKASGRRDF